MNIKITADSTCDLSAELIAQHNIEIIPLSVIKNDKSYLDGIDINPADIFDHVANGGQLCSTSAVSVGQYEDIFTRLSPEYDGIVHINISSDMSSSYQNACVAAADFENVCVIDSRTLTTGQGLVVLKACELAKTCQSLDELKAQLMEFTEKVEASFLVDQLKYLVKGGRCSSAAALGANLLGLKPCIGVKNGKMSVVKKYRGNFTKCLVSYIKDRLADRDDLDDNYLFVTRTPVSAEAEAAVNEAIATYGNFKNVIWTDAGCTVSCHCGPGTLGILFARK